MTTSALKKHCVGRADVVIGPYAVNKLTEREIGILRAKEGCDAALFFRSVLVIRAQIFARNSMLVTVSFSTMMTSRVLPAVYTSSLPFSVRSVP